MKCTRCHVDKPDCTIHCKRLNKDGTTYTRYICRECRRNRWHAKQLSPIPERLHYNWKLDFNSPSPSKAIVTLPPVIRYSTSLAKLVAEGREKNLAIMRKYKKVV